MEKNGIENALKTVGTAVAIGFNAGLAGTIAMTVSQMIEMKITDHESSDTAPYTVREVLDIKHVTVGKTKKISNEVHWVYGTDLGTIRGALGLFKMEGWAATAVHFSAAWGWWNDYASCIKSSPAGYETKTRTNSDRWDA